MKRHEDKVNLPASLSTELMKQRAFEHGQLFWRISARDGRSTVASVLEFTAPEGVIMLPPKVANSLWGLNVRISCLVSILRLYVATYVGSARPPQFLHWAMRRSTVHFHKKIDTLPLVCELNIDYPILTIIHAT